MIYIEEKETNKVPGLTSLFISFNPYKKEIENILVNTTFNIYYNKANPKWNCKDNVWELPLIYCTELIDKLSLYDDIEFKTLEENKVLINYELNDYKTKPYEYQKEGILFGLNNDNWFLLDGIGLGKSLQLIYIAQELKKRNNIEHCLIICGINNLKMNWKKEIEKHSDLDCLVLGQKINARNKLVIGSVKDRVEQLLNPIKEFFIITNIETLREEKIIKAFKKNINKIDLIAVDELHCCKTFQSIQSKHLLLLESKYKIGMTGTLLLNNPLDTYVPLKWIGKEKSIYTVFKNFYCTFVGPTHNILSGFKNLDLLKYQITQCSLRRKKEDVLDLPPKTIITEYVEMDDKQSTFYNNIKNGIIEEVDKVKLTTTSLLSMVARLRQATAFPGILTTENISSAKILRACTLVENIVENDGKVVIFSTFKDTVYELNKLLQKYNPLVATGDIDDVTISQAIDDFQNNDINKVFIGTWQKCGTGITLTRASYLIFIDTPWTDGVFSQCCDRIYRIGTTDKVFIYNLITKDTIDERVLEILNDKKALSEYIIDDTISPTAIQNLKKYIEELK